MQRLPRSSRSVTSAYRGAGAAALLLVVAACGSTGYVPASQAVPVGSGVAPNVAPPQAVAGLATTSTPLGTVVTHDGHTVYRFDKDSAKPSTSTCDGSCAEAWPPVLGDGVPAVRGVSADTIATIGRSDGSQQLTLNGWPLYRFAKDTAPGDVKGEGVSGAWHAIGTDGKPAARPAPSTRPAPTARPAPPAPTGEPAPVDDAGSSGY